MTSRTAKLALATGVVIATIAQSAGRNAAQAGGPINESPAIAVAVSAAVKRVQPFVVRVQPIGGAGDASLNTLGPTTGVYLPEERCVVTSSYRVVDAAGLLVFFNGGARSAATLLAVDSHRQVAVLRVADPPPDPLSAPLLGAPIDSLCVGQTTIAVGRVYLADEPNLAVGILSAKRRLFGRAVQTDANVSPANYGGPLIDLSGRVIGLLTPLAPTGGGAPSDGAGWYDSGIGFAVPWSHIAMRLPTLLAGEDIRRGLAGVSFKPGNPHRAPAVIAKLIPEGPADQAGIRVGDRVVSVDGSPTPSITALRFAMGMRDAGDRVEIETQRGDGVERLRFTVALTDKLPAIDQSSNRETDADEQEAGEEGDREGKATQSTEET